MRTFVINYMPEEIRMAVLDEKGQLTDVAMERQTEVSILNHIYKGVIRNVLPGMQSAFVDIGLGRNVYLNLRQGHRLKSLGQLFEGQVLTVQVIKEEMLGKSARVTADISLAGRYVVYLPYSTGVHVSHKITDTAKRQALKQLGASYAEKGSFVLRTAACQASIEEIEADMVYTLHTWQQLEKRYKVARNGTEIYGDADFYFRLFRNYAIRADDQIVIDDQEAYQALVNLQAHIKTGATIQSYQGKRPIFSAYQLEEDWNALCNSRVDLPSGGFLQIDHTEAMTVIDVNSGHYTGSSSNDTAVLINREAAIAIATQLRLRDIGGIIVIDFIDMIRQSDRQALLKVLEQAVKRDRIKTVVCGMTRLGLVEMTRKRERKGLSDRLFAPCSQCGGTGRMLSAETVYLQIVRRLRELGRTQQVKTDLLIHVHPEVAEFFTKEKCKELSSLLHHQVEVEKVTEQSIEAYSLLASQ